MTPDPLAHYERHQSEYDQITDMLSDVRTAFESADPLTQKLMVFDSSVFAVMSVQNSVDILERAFRQYARADDWEDVREVMTQVNYGNQKYDYIRRNFELIFETDVGDRIVGDLLWENTETAVDTIVENLNGVSWIKGAFVPAMLGFTDVMCIDTNVAQMVPADSVVAKGYKSSDEYADAVDRVKAEFPGLAHEVSTFMLQWVVFDANRGTGVTYHEEWFNVMLPGSPFGRQADITDF